nr:hypothetical protein [Legionella jordanis]
MKFQTGMQLEVISNLQELEALSSTCMQEMLKIKNNCDWLFSKQIFNIEEEIKAQLEEKRADLSAATKLSEPEVTVSSPVAIPSQGLDSVPHLSQQPSAMSSKDGKNETQVLVTGSSLFGEELSQTLVKPNNMAHVREMQLTKVIRQLEQLQLKIAQLNDDKYGDAAKALQFIHTGISTVNQQFIDGNLTREAYRQACERVFKQADVDELQTFRYLKTKKIAEVLVNLIALVATAFVGYGVAACALKRYSVFQFNTDSTNRVNKLQSEVACAASPAA